MMNRRSNWYSARRASAGCLTAVLGALSLGACSGGTTDGQLPAGFGPASPTTPGAALPGVPGIGVQPGVPGTGVTQPGVPGTGIAQPGDPAAPKLPSNPVDAPPVEQVCDVGSTALRRLNRLELRNTLGTLFGVPADVSTLLPDPGAAGFDNIAGVLTVSPTLLGGYERVFERVLDDALADPQARAKAIACASEAAQVDCARASFTQWLPRAWRQPVSPADVDRLVAAVEPLFAVVGFEGAMKVGFKSALLSHRFLYHLKLASPNGEAAPLSDYELATRLSYFLWSDMPDEALFEKAAAGLLTSTDVIAAEVQRMLEDEKSSALMEGFVSQWLKIRGFEELEKSPDDFPEFTPQLRRDMQAETEAFMQVAIDENWPLRKLLTPDEFFASSQLLAHYGYAAPSGAAPDGAGMTRMPVGTSGRGGLLTQGSILSVTSPGEQDAFAVVNRGVFVLEHLLCAAPPPPPADVPTLEGSPIDLTQPLKVVLAEHNNNPACAGCHSLMDPIGHALEGFDWIGRKRDADHNGNVVDTSGEFPGGQVAFDGPAQLAEALAADARFASCISENLMTYALGRIPDEIGSCAVRQVVSNGAADIGLRDLIQRIALSPSFLSRGTENQ